MYVNGTSLANNFSPRFSSSCASLDRRIRSWAGHLPTPYPCESAGSFLSFIPMQISYVGPANVVAAGTYQLTISAAAGNQSTTEILTLTVK